MTADPTEVRKILEYLLNQPEVKRVDPKQDQQTERLRQVVYDLTHETTDTEPAEAILRGLEFYRSCVRHIAGGGQLRLVAADGRERKVTTRVRRNR